MTVQLTYFGIHLAFLLPPILILGRSRSDATAPGGGFAPSRDSAS